jgi:diguanylate cyclase
MQDQQKKPEQQSPADIAREAFRRLGTRRIAPTPDAYRAIYEEIAGQEKQPGAEKVLVDLAASLAGAPGEIAQYAAQFKRALELYDWQEYGSRLDHLVETHLKRTAPPISSTPKKSSIPLVDEPPKPVTAPAQPAATDESPQAGILRELLARTLTFAIGTLLQGAPELAAEAETLAVLVKDAHSEQALNDVSARLKQLCFRIELKSADMAEEHELLLRLFKLLLENVSELLEDDSWLSGQIAGVQNLLAGPISHDALMDATRNLKEVIYKQGMLKHSLTEAKITVKNMMITFIDRLGAVAVSTGDYHEKIDQYSRQISQARDISELNRVLDDVMRDTRIAQTEALRSRDEMVTARQEVQEAENRIQELEAKLEQMSELVREDQLTGSLNRRGLDDVFERELARSERRKSPLCIAMLDLDDFKRLNDTYGHSAGDEALVHLVRVVKNTLRTMDVIARFGGEEFLIVLPDTPLEDAVQTVTRLQRELTKRIFMHNNERLLITFSAGVALRMPGEDAAALVKRADNAQYRAKKAGKNRVVAAD